MTETERIPAYNEAVSLKHSQRDVVAIFYNEQTDQLSYACFEMGNRASIERLLGSSDGKAFSYTPSKSEKYWVLIGSDNGSFLMFRQKGTNGFADIDSSAEDLGNAQYLSSM